MNAELFKAAMAEVICAKNPLLMAECFDFVLDLGIQRKTQTQLAREHGLTKATVSAICRRIECTYIKYEKPKIRLIERKQPKKRPARDPWPFLDSIKRLEVGA